MHAINLYKPLGVSGNRFKKTFQDNEVLYEHAKNFWNNIDSNGLIIIIIFLVIGALGAIYYYKWYNNKPGRRYLPKKWFIWLGITAVTSFVVSLIILLFIARPRLEGSFTLELKIAFGNALYAAIVYLITSVLLCNCWQTNAYRMFKFKK